MVSGAIASCARSTAAGRRRREQRVDAADHFDDLGADAATRRSSMLLIERRAALRRTPGPASAGASRA